MIENGSRSEGIPGVFQATRVVFCAKAALPGVMGSALFGYTDKVFPQSNYSNKKLIFSLGALPVYTNCGNDVWYADVNYVGEFDTTYAITLLEDGTLLLQNYFTVDGAPMVSYEWFRHVS